MWQATCCICELQDLQYRGNKCRGPERGQELEDLLNIDASGKPDARQAKNCSDQPIALIDPEIIQDQPHNVKI
jgi:hypothetical protein